MYREYSKGGKFTPDSGSISTTRITRLLSNFLHRSGRSPYRGGAFLAEKSSVEYKLEDGVYFVAAHGEGPEEGVFDRARQREA